VDLVGGITIALHRAFEMGHERGTFDRQIIVVFHYFFFHSRQRWLPVIARSASDEAIQTVSADAFWIASLRSQ
jgi:hypothetical protein